MLDINTDVFRVTFVFIYLSIKLNMDLVSVKKVN